MLRGVSLMGEVFYEVVGSADRQGMGKWHQGVDAKSLKNKRRFRSENDIRVHVRVAWPIARPTKANEKKRGRGATAHHGANLTEAHLL